VSEHVIPRRIYATILFALLILTGTTYWVATINLGPLNVVIALTIATCKATLVVLFFMHARYSPRRTRVVILAGLFWLVILLGLTLSDYLTRPFSGRI
jgi:cytochrome c oxidase subunit 4